MAWRNSRGSYPGQGGTSVASKNHRQHATSKRSLLAAAAAARCAPDCFTQFQLATRVFQFPLQQLGVGYQHPIVRSHDLRGQALPAHAARRRAPCRRKGSGPRGGSSGVGPMFFGVVAVDVHLAHVRVIYAPKPKVDDEQAPQAAVDLQQTAMPTATRVERNSESSFRSCLVHFVGRLGMGPGTVNSSIVTPFYTITMPVLSCGN